MDIDEEENDLEKVIYRNKLIPEREKQQLLVDLQHEPALQSLLENLSTMFKEHIFHEILYVCDWSWEKYIKCKN